VLLAYAIVQTSCAFNGCTSPTTGGDVPPAGSFMIGGVLSPGASGDGATVNLSGASSQTATADGTGAFTFVGLANGNYTVTPSKVGFAFSPPSRAVTVRGADQTNIDFSATPFTANLTLDGAQTFQTMGGMGVNINVNSWNGGELRPALDLLTAAPPAGNGASLFRVIRDPMTWVSNESDIPLLHALDPATLARIYETSAMRDLWSTIAYLNSKGIRGNQIILNFMGWTPTWLGGSGVFGRQSSITVGKEGELATVIASLVYYGRAIRGVDFNLLSPLNEPDANCLEGPCCDPLQNALVLQAVVAELDAMGQIDVRIVGPDAAVLGNSDGYISALMAIPSVAARTDHLSLHTYGNGTTTRAPYPGHDYWITENAASCPSCDNAGTPSQGEWSFARASGDAVLTDLDGGLSAVCIYDGYDSFYYHHNSFGYWGLLSYDQSTHVYSKRKRFYVNAQMNAFVPPGAVRVSLNDSVSGLGTTVGFVHAASGKVTIVGHNVGGAPITIQGRLLNVPTVTSFEVYVTDSGSRSLQRAADVPVSGGQFVVTIPADAFFSLTH
jgi:O-glycosyl hydrolase